MATYQSGPKLTRHRCPACGRMFFLGIDPTWKHKCPPKT